MLFEETKMRPVLQTAAIAGVKTWKFQKIPVFLTCCLFQLLFGKIRRFLYFQASPVSNGAGIPVFVAGLCLDPLKIVVEGMAQAPGLDHAGWRRIGRSSYVKTAKARTAKETTVFLFFRLFYWLNCL